ncbi:elongator complex protein 6-like [Varroa destructor]|uniref:Elongator complex protein 6 n=1 Tax=Varroa destructor TaxID=109461 RepID=A0A7M7MG77_VARDE|nr:elongator complex protein 6-like [Varroa destructor]
MFFEFNKFLATGTAKDFLLISSKGSSSHNFVISHLLVNAARNRKKVQLICSGESFQFYLVVCKRAGVCLQDMQSSGNLRATCLVSAWKDQISAGHFPTVPDIITNDVNSDEDLLIIDDLGPLIDFATLSEVIRMMHSLKSLVPGMLAVGMRADDSGSEHVMKLVRTMCSMWVEAHPLSTGYSKEVHGVLEMVSFKPDQGGTTHKTMHYRATERGTKLLVIGGHVAAVI